MLTAMLGEPASLAVGVWRVYPEWGIAINCHNGGAVYIDKTPTGLIVWGRSVPAPWMLEQLADWVAKHMVPR